MWGGGGVLTMWVCRGTVCLTARCCPPAKGCAAMPDNQPAPSPGGRSSRRPRPNALTRCLNRAPVAVYRAGLGRLFGRALLMITHRGRRSGRTYRTVVQVVRYDPVTQESVVMAGWGAGSDWYQNLRAAPALAIETGGVRYRPVQRFLSPDEVAAELLPFSRRYRGVLSMLGRRLGVPQDGSDGARRALAAVLPMVGFRPVAGLSPRP